MPALEPHPHAAAVLGAALARRARRTPTSSTGRPARGKRAVARAFAAALLRGARPTPATRARACEHGVASRPDMGRAQRRARDAPLATSTRPWSPPRAHAVRGARRVFVLERADTMNDQAANRMLKTLEEPPSFVV